MRTRLICDSRYEEARGFLLSLTRGEGPVLRTFCDNRNKVWLTMHGDERWVVKRYKRPTLLNRFVYATLRPSKAERAFRYAYRLLDAGFDTAQPVAYIETFSHGMFDIGYFISRHVDLSDLTQLDGLGGDERQRLLDDLGRHTARMHDAGIVDFDYNVHNILWRRDGSGGFRFTLVDINRTRFGDRRLLHCAIALATNAELGTQPHARQDKGSKGETPPTEHGGKGRKNKGGMTSVIPPSPVGLPGFEPGKSGPESEVLPLHHSPIGFYGCKYTYFIPFAGQPFNIF